jgi:hypothetical protein
VKKPEEAAPSSILGPSFLPNSEVDQIGSNEDDISLLRPNPGASTVDAVACSKTTPPRGIGQILYGPWPETVFDAPGLSAQVA